MFISVALLKHIQTHISNTFIFLKSFYTMSRKRTLKDIVDLKDFHNFHLSGVTKNDEKKK